jgi:hypothetical protein
MNSNYSCAPASFANAQLPFPLLSGFSKLPLAPLRTADHYRGLTLGNALSSSPRSVDLKWTPSPPSVNMFNNKFNTESRFMSDEMRAQLISELRQQQPLKRAESPTNVFSALAALSAAASRVAAMSNNCPPAMSNSCSPVQLPAPQDTNELQCRQKQLCLPQVASTPEARSKGKRRVRHKKLCKIDGCVTYAKGGGVCIKHGGGKRCSVASCERLARFAGSLCYAHGVTEKKHAAIALEKERVRQERKEKKRRLSGESESDASPSKKRCSSTASSCSSGDEDEYDVASSDTNSVEC